MRRILFYLISAFVALSCIVGIPMFFIGDDFLSDVLAKGLNLKVSPGFTGGEVARDFIDELDEGKRLMRYTVYQPVYNAVWQQNPDYWQIEQTYDLSAGKPEEIRIQIEDGKSSGYELVIIGGDAFVRDAHGNLICSCENYFLEGGKKIRTRIPLADKRLQGFYTAEKTWHRIYAEDEIASSDEPIFAVSVNMKEKGDKKNMKETIEKIRDRYYEKKDELLSSKQLPEGTEIEKAYACFCRGEYGKAESMYKKILERESENPLANAYYGSCLAIRGGDSNVFLAMSLVKKAYVYLNRGVELAAGKESEFETLMNRAEVSISVPNSIFGKMEVGARDFERAAELYKLKSESAILSEYDRIYLAYIYASAAQCYSELGREVEEALSMKKAEQYFSDSIVPDN